MVDFTTWRSLIDGAGVIPDSVITRDADTSSVSSSEYEGEVLNLGPKNHPYTSTDGDLTGTVSGSSLGSLSEGGNNNVRSINNVELFV